MAWRAIIIRHGFHSKSGKEGMSVITAELAGWDSFYVIIGSAAGALIGLQFVVIGH